MGLLLAIFFAQSARKKKENNWAKGQEENFTDDYRVKHFKEQLFTGYDITEFENLFSAQAGMTNEEMKAYCGKLFPTLKRWKKMWTNFLKS